MLPEHVSYRRQVEPILQALYAAALREDSFLSVVSVLKAELRASHCSVASLCPRTFDLLVRDNASSCLGCVNRAKAAGQPLLMSDTGCVLAFPHPGDGCDEDQPHHCLFALLERGQEEIVCISFGREPRDPPFEERDAQTLGLFVSHLRKARQVQKTILAQQALAATLHRTLEGLLEVLPMAAALLDEGGHVLLANREAARVIATANGVYAGAGGLRLRQAGRTVIVSEVLRRLSALDHLDASEGEIVVVQRSADDKPVHAAILPWGDQHPVTPYRPVALMLFHDPDRPVQLEAVALRKMFGFTEAEIRVATMLVNGRGADQLALELGISLHTARTHLKRMLAKVGAVRQTELIRVLLCCFRHVQAGSERA